MIKSNIRRIILVGLVLSIAIPSLGWAGQRSDLLSSRPLSFIPNHGQTDSTVRFHTQTLGGAAFFTDREVVFSFSSSPTAFLRSSFVGVRPHPKVTAGGPLPGKVNLFVGNDAKRWRSGLPTYDGIAYRQLYAGVDLLYEGQAGHLKATYTVEPGAEPANIRWRYDGASALRIDSATGDLRIHLANGLAMVEKAPVAWQEFAGRRHPVDVAFVLHGARTVGFTVGSFDPAHPLVIDPTFVYSTYLGGTDDDEGFGIATDANGAIYLTGSTFSASFPLANPVQSWSANGEVFVTKIDPATNTLLYSTYLGGSDWDAGMAIAVDNSGNAYVTGGTDSSNFPVTGPLQPTYGGGSRDAFIVQLDSAGGLVSSSFLGGEESDTGTGIAVDAASGEVLVVGQTSSSSFPTVNAWQGSHAGAWDLFVSKLDPSVSSFVYSTLFGGSGLEQNPDIAVDGAGNAFVTASTDSLNLPIMNAAYPMFGGGFYDALVAKLDAGGALIYSTYLGGTENDYGSGIATDVQGNAWVTGSTRSSSFPLAGQPLQGVLDGAADAFLARFDPNGAPLFSTYLGGSGLDSGVGVAVDADANAHLVGSTDSTNFPLVQPLQATLNGWTDAFAAVVGPTGSQLLLSTYLGGSGDEAGTDIVVGVQGDTHVTGITSSPDFPLVWPFQSTLGGGSDAFVSVIDPELAFCRELWSAEEMPMATVIDFDGLGHGTVIAGSYQSNHGVTFESNLVTRAKIYGNEPNEARSATNVAINDAVFPNTSSHVPMTIELGTAKTYTGLWIGNGENAELTAVLTAYDEQENVICQAVRHDVPEEHTLFVGFHDPAGRIVSIALDYGASWLNESIDDLSFVP